MLKVRSSFQELLKTTFPKFLARVIFGLYYMHLPKVAAIRPSQQRFSLSFYAYFKLLTQEPKLQHLTIQKCVPACNH